MSELHIRYKLDHCQISSGAGPTYNAQLASGAGPTYIQSPTGEIGYSITAATECEFLESFLGTEVIIYAFTENCSMVIAAISCLPKRLQILSQQQTATKDLPLLYHPSPVYHPEPP